MLYRLSEVWIAKIQLGFTPMPGTRRVFYPATS